MRNHSYKTTIYTENPSCFQIVCTPANNSVIYLSGIMGQQYVSILSTVKDGKANYYILPLEKSSPVHLLIISQSVSCC